MNQIKIGAVVSYLALFLNVIIGLVYTPWMIKSIGKNDYGLFTLAMSVISLFVFDFGLGSAITRYVSKFLAEKKKDKVDQLLGLVFKLYLLGDLIILIGLVVVYTFLPYIYKGLTIEELEKFKTVYSIAALFCLLSFPFIPLNGIITAYEKFVQLKACDLVHKLIIVILMSACLLLGGGLFSLVIVNSIAGILIIMFKLSILGRHSLLSIQWSFWDKSMLKTVMGFSIWVTIIQLAQRCIFNIAPSILAVYATSASITVLGIAICLEGYTFSFANAINGMFLPKVSRMIAENDRKKILELMVRIGRIQIYIIGAICGGFLCIGRDFINLWLGDAFSEVYVCSLMIILPSFMQLPQEIGNTTIIADGKVKQQAIAYIVMAAVNLILAFPLTYIFGVSGLCFSIMLSYIVRTIMMDFVFYKYLKINVLTFVRESYFKITPILFIIVGIVTSINTMITCRGWLGVAIKSIIFIIIYFVGVFVCSMNTSERKLFTSPLLRIKDNLVK